MSLSRFRLLGLAALIALHGMGLWLLAAPFIPVLWALGLMNAPGWFAWPKPLGMVLVYAAWVVALLGLASIARRAAGARRQP